MTAFIDWQFANVQRELCEYPWIKIARFARSHGGTTC